MVIFVEVDNQGCPPHYVAAIHHMGGLSQCGARSVCHWVSLYKLHNGSLHGAVIAFCGLNTMMAIKVCRTSLPKERVGNAVGLSAAADIRSFFSVYWAVSFIYCCCANYNAVLLKMAFYEYCT